MQRLVAKEKEPITPFIDKVRQLYEEYHVSTVLVAGGCGDYFQVADTVLMMDEYKPVVVTEKARAIASSQPERNPEGGSEFGAIRERIPLPSGIDPTRGGKVKIKAHRLQGLQFGKEEIELERIEQLVDPSQTRAIGALLCYAAQQLADGKRSVREIAERLQQLQRQGLDFLARREGEHPGDYAFVRSLELACALNRLRTLKIKE
jgi:predicted ABC-class ATPase